MAKKLSISLLLFLTITLCYSQKHIPYNQKNISYMGRVEYIGNQYANIFWPGTTITMNFKGTDIKAIFKNGKEEAYFYAIVDGDESKAIRIKPDTIKTTYVLAASLPTGKHSVQLFKLSNNTSVSSFYGFELNKGGVVLKANIPARKKIEFYGNSITAGHGVDVPMGQNDSGSPEFFNNYWTYAARTARHFDAQYSCIARSGIGVMVSWFPIIMSEMYDRLNPEDSKSKWDFAKYTPDVVVINLFQNDMWLTNNPKHPQFIARFGTTAPSEAEIIQSYQNFVKSIRNKYPKASIICVLGSMNATEEGSLWPGYIDKAVNGLSDAKIYTHFFPYKKTSGHPKALEQKVMANDLIDFIDKNIKW